MKVLVVDDEADARYLIAALLKGHGHEVIEAEDGIDALEKARHETVDIIVTDVLMPRMDGYQLCREWKSDPELSKIPFVFYSATYTEPADEQFADNLGADAYFIKPQDPDTLVSLIEEQLRLHRDKAATPRAAVTTEETAVLREYNERLVAKLEQKVTELATANAGLKQALEVLSDEVDVKKTLIEQLTSDIEQKEKVEADLRSANEIIGAVIESSPMAMISIDLSGKTTLWNPAAEALFGWGAEEMLGKDYRQVVIGDLVEHFEDRWREAIDSDAGYVIERPARRKDGARIDIRLSGAPLHDSQGAVNGIVNIISDVTEARRIETTKATFLSMVSHELRTPLTAIIGYADLMGQIDLREKPELFAQMLEKIRERGNTMRGLVDDLLDLSQIQSGPLRLDPAALDMAVVAREAAGQVDMGPVHTLVVEAPGDLPAAAADRDRIAKVIRSLVANAVKYSPDGGDVTVRVIGEDPWVRVAVSDQGIGIDAADVEQIFERFTQADMSDTRTFGGVGVGLFLAKQIVTAHKGTLTVESTPGVGSTFTFSVPVAP
jgi:PAS domain S-box-containing protein